MVKQFLGKQYAKLTAKKVHKWASDPLNAQKSVFDYLIKMGKNTLFGREHDFSKIKTYEDYKSAVPVRSYEEFKPYIDRIIKGEKNVSWINRPLYFAKTSGTTSGTKFIPISKESIHNHLDGARNTLLMYIYNSGNTDFVKRKMIFLSGSPVLEKTGPGILTGRLSGIVNHHIPFYLKLNQLPSYSTNCIFEWEEKVGKILEETLHSDMGLISGIPPWVQTYFDKIHEKTGKTIKEVFPNFSVFVHGGVNYEPYKQILENSIGGHVDTLEAYPASEGYIAFQDTLDNRNGLLLVLNSGIFFEFIPLEEYFTDNPGRISLQNVETDVNYVVIINNSAGLWGYNLGDTIRFVSKDPYRIVVTGRVKQFISAFGEHVIIEEIENSISEVSEQMNVSVKEFTVAPNVNPNDGLPRHDWFIEFEIPPQNLEDFRLKIDKNLCDRNSYYNDLIEGNILEPLHIQILKKNSFNKFLKSIGKYGGQYKIPRLANNRDIADKLIKFMASTEGKNI